MNRRRDDRAVFWCGILSALLFDQMDRSEEREELKRLSGEEVLYPNGVRKKPSLRTLQRKLAAYRNGGFDSLLRQRRGDRGKPRSRPEELFLQAIELKKDQPRRSPEMINMMLKERTGKTIPRSTLYRHLGGALFRPRHFVLGCWLLWQSTGAPQQSTFASLSNPGRGDPSSAGHKQHAGPQALDGGAAPRHVARRLLPRPLRAGERSVGLDPSLGLHRCPQSFRGFRN